MVKSAAFPALCPSAHRVAFRPCVFSPLSPVVPRRVPVAAAAAAVAPVLFRFLFSECDDWPKDLTGCRSFSLSLSLAHLIRHHLWLSPSLPLARAAATAQWDDRKCSRQNESNAVRICGHGVPSGGKAS